MKHVYQIDHVPVRKKIGNKAIGLRKLLRHGFHIPHTWIISSELWGEYQDDPKSALDILSSELGMIDESKNYAVRSSSELEDGSKHSYAGQFTTVLNVSGKKAILDAVTKVWDSAESLPAGLYDEKKNDSQVRRRYGRNHTGFGRCHLVGRCL